MRIEPFLMERWQSTHEHHVEINLSDSGVHPMTLRELGLSSAELEGLLDERLIYTQTNGTPELRERIAALYPGAGPQDIEATNGGAEANFLALWTLLEAGDEVVIQLPNYMQVHGLAESMGATVRPWRMRADFEAGRWEFDLEELEQLVSSRTKLICLCNPNNPTGARMEAASLDRVARIAEKHGAWVLCDEIYRGSDLDGGETSTLWGRTDRAVITSSLSKSYGLPGLRLGWIAAPAQLVDEMWLRHDYTTIAPGALSDRVATRVLSPDVCPAVLARTRELLTANHALVAGWLAEHTGTLQYIPPHAGAMLFLRYTPEINSSELAERLRVQKSVLLVPGDHYGMDGWLRIGFGGETDHVRTGLARVHELLSEL